MFFTKLQYNHFYLANKYRYLMALDTLAPKPLKLKAGQKASQGLGFAGAEGSPVIDREVSLINQSINILRTARPADAIRVLSRFNWVFSAAVSSYVSLAMSGYTVTGYDRNTQQFSLESSLAANAVLTSLSTLVDSPGGYGDKLAIDALLETLIKETLLTGGTAAELVLDKTLFPSKVVPIPVTTLSWIVDPKTQRTTPEQRLTTTVSLDIPTFFYSALQQSSISPIPNSPMEAALQMIFVYSEFIEDIYKILKKAGHARLNAAVDMAKTIENAPGTVKNDAAKLREFLKTTLADVTNALQNVAPEEGFVTFDNVNIGTIQAKGEKSDYAPLLEALSGMMATSLKSMPSALGMRIGGSQSLSNTESLIYLKNVASLQQPAETVMSRALTLATRLATNLDCYIVFKFKPVNIRPEAELSAHRSVDLATTLRMLSMGWLTDDEASYLSGCGPRAPGAPNMSGTMFMSGTSSDTTQVLPQDMPTDTDGAQERTVASGTKNGSATPRGGGNN